MVQVVLSLEKKYDEKLRKLAREILSGKKGALSEIVERGIDLVEKEARREAAYEKLLDYSKNAKSWGIGTFDRNEANERESSC